MPMLFTSRRAIENLDCFVTEEAQKGVLYPVVRAAQDNRSAGAAGMTPLEAKAARMHLHTRHRSRHFLTPVMADNAMGIMLSLFVGELQGRRVGAAILAAANLLGQAEMEALVDTLVNAGLAIITEHSSGEWSVGLTPIGSARMRSYIDDHPDV